jgi:hypothetical protein
MGINRYDKPTDINYIQTYVDQYVPLPFEAMRENAKYRAVQADAVQKDLDALQAETGKRLDPLDTGLNREYIIAVNKDIKEAYDAVGGDVIKLRQYAKDKAAEVKGFYEYGPGSIGVKTVEEKKAWEEVVKKGEMDAAYVERASEVSDALYQKNNAMLGGEAWEAPMAYKNIDISKKGTEANQLKESSRESWGAFVDGISGDPTGKYISDVKNGYKSVSEQRVYDWFKSSIYQDADFDNKVRAHYTLATKTAEVMGKDFYKESGIVPKDHKGNIIPNPTDYDYYTAYKDQMFMETIQGFVKAIPHSETTQSGSVKETAEQTAKGTKKGTEYSTPFSVMSTIPLKNPGYDQDVVDNPDEASAKMGDKASKTTTTFTDGVATIMSKTSFFKNVGQKDAKQNFQNAVNAYIKNNNLESDKGSAETNMKIFMGKLVGGGPKAEAAAIAMGFTKEGVKELKQTAKNMWNEEVNANYQLMKALVPNLPEDYAAILKQQWQAYTTQGLSVNANHNNVSFLPKVNTPEYNKLQPQVKLITAIAHGDEDEIEKLFEKYESTEANGAEINIGFARRISETVAENMAATKNLNVEQPFTNYIPVSNDNTSHDAGQAVLKDFNKFIKKEGDKIWNNETVDVLLTDGTVKTVKEYYEGIYGTAAKAKETFYKDLEKNDFTFGGKVQDGLVFKLGSGISFKMDESSSFNFNTGIIDPIANIEMQVKSQLSNVKARNGMWVDPNYQITTQIDKSDKGHTVANITAALKGSDGKFHYIPAQEAENYLFEMEKLNSGLMIVPPSQEGAGGYMVTQPNGDHHVYSKLEDAKAALTQIYINK